MATIEEIEVWFGRPLPEPYCTFLSQTAEAFFAQDNQILIYGRNDVRERNDTYESQTYCPSCLMIGDDSGGMAFILSVSDDKVYRVGMGTMTPDCFELVAESFEVWMTSGFQSNKDF